MSPYYVRFVRGTVVGHWGSAGSEFDHWRLPPSQVTNIQTATNKIKQLTARNECPDVNSSLAAAPCMTSLVAANRVNDSPIPKSASAVLESTCGPVAINVPWSETNARAHRYDGCQLYVTSCVVKNIFVFSLELLQI